MGKQDEMIPTTRCEWCDGPMLWVALKGYVKGYEEIESGVMFCSDHCALKWAAAEGRVDLVCPADLSAEKPPKPDQARDTVIAACAACADPIRDDDPEVRLCRWQSIEQAFCSDACALGGLQRNQKIRLRPLRSWTAGDSTP